MAHTVLVLDDDLEFSNRIVARELESREFRVLVAGKIKEARSLLAKEHPDLLIVDGLLPDGNGMDFIAELRGGGATTPIIFVSAFWKDMETHRRLTALGNVQVMRKPLSVTDLGNRVEFMLAPESVEIDIDLD